MVTIEIFEKSPGLRTIVKDSLYSVDCPLDDELYVKKAIFRLKALCDELPKPTHKDVDKNGIKLDKAEDPKSAKVSANYLQTLGKVDEIARDKVKRLGKSWNVMMAANIINQVISCTEKSKDGFYYYCEETNTPIPEVYFKGYPGVNLIKQEIVAEELTAYGPMRTWCYTFTKD